MLSGLVLASIAPGGAQENLLSADAVPDVSAWRGLEMRNVSRPIYRRQLIVGGFAADIAQFPWAVFIGKQRG